MDGSIVGVESFQCPNCGLYLSHTNKETKKLSLVPLECHVSKGIQLQYIQRATSPVLLGNQ